MVRSMCSAGSGGCQGGIGLIFVFGKFDRDPGRIHSWIPVTMLSWVTEGPPRSVRSHGTGDKRGLNLGYLRMNPWHPGSSFAAFDMPHDLSVINAYLLGPWLT